MKQSINLKPLEFKKYYKEHCNIDNKLHNLLINIVPLYKEYNKEYQNNLKNPNISNTQIKKRLNNLHKDIKGFQEQIYLNRLEMSNVLNLNTFLNSNDKLKYSDKLITFYQNNSNNLNSSNNKNQMNYNNQVNYCLEPFFDSNERLNFNIKCNRNFYCNQNQSSDCKLKVSEYYGNNKFSNQCNTYNLLPNCNVRSSTILDRYSKNDLLQSRDTVSSNTSNDVSNDRNIEIPINISSGIRRSKKVQLSNVNLLQPDRPRMSKLSKKVSKNFNSPNTQSRSNNFQGVNVSQLDNAYINKHNELMSVYKAYKILFNKVNKYKNELDKVKTLTTSKLINNNTMSKMLKDQKYVMNSVKKMQDVLVEKNVLKPEERVPTEPVVSHPQNMNHFNTHLKEQINNVISKKHNVFSDKNIDSLRRQLQKIKTSNNVSTDKINIKSFV